MVELLVVLGILAILMAVLLGVTSGSTESARVVQCQTNMRNLAMAVQSYAMSTDFFPYAAPWKMGKRTYRGWIGTDTGSKMYLDDPKERKDILEDGSIWSAINGSSDSYVCPSHKQYAARNKKGEPLWSYAMSAYFGFQKNPLDYGRQYTLLRRSDRHLLFAEIRYDGDGEELDPVLQYGGYGDEVIAFHHKSGKDSIGNVCFADGHVEKLFAPKKVGEIDAKKLTQYLCRPVDDDGSDLDLSFDGAQYHKVKN